MPNVAVKNCNFIKDISVESRNLCFIEFPIEFMHKVSWIAYVISGLEHPFHVLVHVVMIQRHEKCVDDDTKGDEKLYEWIEHQKRHVFLKLKPQPAAVPYAKDIDATQHRGQQFVLERRPFFIVVCRKVIGRSCNAC